MYDGDGGGSYLRIVNVDMIDRGCSETDKSLWYRKLHRTDCLQVTTHLIMGTPVAVSVSVLRWSRIRYTMQESRPPTLTRYVLPAK